MADFSDRESTIHPFFKVLQRLIEEPAEDFSLAAAARLAEEFSFIGSGGAKARRRSSARRDRGEDFLEFADKSVDDPVEADPPVEADAIREELNIRADHPIAELRRIRKRFAARNHPDLSRGSRRMVAEQRMKIANSIIDTEIEHRRRQGVR